jgi:integrase
MDPDLNPDEEENRTVPARRKKERITGQFFTWLLWQRGGVWYADGRSNRPPAGRHSLGTRDRREALERLRRLDLTKAAELGRADPALLRRDQAALLPLEDGRRRYLEFVARPAVQGGAAPASAKRYRAVLDKFAAFAPRHGVRYWQQVTKDVLRRYGQWLKDDGYGYATQYLELTTLKQVLKWLAGEGLLPGTNAVALPLRKPRGTTTYCYTQEQVRAVAGFCRSRAGLEWLADVVVALTTTGLRIGELAGLRWSDVDLRRGDLRLTDTTRRGRTADGPEARATKSHRDRTLPVHSDLKPVLERLPRQPDGWVFHGPKGGRLKPDTVRNVLKRDVLPALAAQFPAAADDPGIVAGRLHSFRHYFCSTSADAGTSEQMLMAWLGHRDSAMVRHYYHLRQDEARRHMARVRFLDAPPPWTDESTGAP